MKISSEPSEKEGSYNHKKGAWMTNLVKMKVDLPVTEGAFFSSGRDSCTFATCSLFSVSLPVPFISEFLSSFTFIVSTEKLKESQQKQKLRLCAISAAQGLRQNRRKFIISKNPSNVTYRRFSELASFLWLMQILYFLPQFPFLLYALTELYRRKEDYCIYNYKTILFLFLSFH